MLEKEIEKLDETQQNTVVLFVRFLLSQQSPACLTDAPTTASKIRTEECERSARVEALYGSLRLPPEMEGQPDDELKDGYFREKYGAFA
ncbi:MAG: hypothetical protein J6V72_13290 [Kiritimatiellae bacterium]|nr:hypothetical protein [Kiritimatiellia bacterium]